jgi:Zn-dependent M16 (insulinase) family peptidase
MCCSMFSLAKFFLSRGQCANLDSDTFTFVQNLKDFYNLVNVYLDSVLHPALTPWTLKQEGWHFEIEDPKQPLTYKGVVFNEMKGVYSSPDAVHGRAAQQVNIFPTRSRLCTLPNVAQRP